jgi:protein SCO1/2
VAAAPEVLRNVHHVAIGEYAPEPPLVSQNGRPFSLRDLHGDMVVMAFVYTRCRDARECPAVSARFHALQEKFRGLPVRLVLVTLDPAYDRPAVLERYGKTFGQDPARWTLVTGDPDTVLDFAAQFDVTAFPDERVGLIHPERTVVLDTYGAIRELIDEGSWTPDEIVATVAHDRRLASNPFERLDLWLSSAAVAVCGNAVAGFSGFTDLLTVAGIAAFFTFLLWRLGRGIARGTT